MFSIKTRMTAAIALALLLAPAGFGQERAAQTPQPAVAPSAARSPEFVEEKGFKTKIIEVKYRDPDSLYRVVKTLGSGFKGAAISTDSNFKTMTVRDFPENIAVIEEAIKRLDAPEAPRPDIELHVHVLIASNAAGVTGDRPAELNDVIKQLQATLAYKNYSLMTSSILRAKEGRGVENSGVAESKLFNVESSPTNPTFYSYRLDPITIDSSPGTGKVQTGNFSFNMRVPLNLNTSIQYENVGFRTPVSVREGEKVVVGTTTMGDKGLIVVLSARIIR
ncbi:MAG TPA: hypothetical protein VJZ26_12770 [Blastocatellia bacterium]|nr:hypothetical protein [Blastocatellia bacterium]